MTSNRSVIKDLSISALVAGIISALVNYSGPFLIVLEATRAAGLDEAHTASWVWAVSIGNGVCSLLLSIFTRMPIIVAWSTPGAALLIASLGGFTFQEAIGAFLVASIAAAIFGFTGWFGWILNRIPAPILQALLAGILLPFVIKAANAFESAPLLAGSVILTYFIGKRFFDRYAVLAALTVGIATAAVTDSFQSVNLGLTLTGPVWTTPTFHLSAIVSIALPLFVVTMASQNAPGLALLRSEGYKPNDRLLVGSISTASVAIAPFGGHAINIAAITAAICTGPESHPDRDRRYIAGISAGITYLIVGIFGGLLVSGFQSIPRETIAALAAVALLASTATSLRSAMTGDTRTDAASLTTMAVTMSGLVVLGVGSAFWGLVAGCAAYSALSFSRGNSGSSTSADVLDSTVSTDPQNLPKPASNR